jgi:AraC family transcriptional regulator, transcriptional activator of pobA
MPFHPGKALFDSGKKLGFIIYFLYIYKFGFTPIKMNIQRINQGIQRFEDKENYSILWMDEGPKEIIVDLHNVSTCSNFILYMLPGTNLMVKPRKEFVQGWILSFSKDYLRSQHLDHFQIRNIEFIRTTEELPLIILSPKIGKRINGIAEMINELAASRIPNKESAISALLKTLLVYCDSHCNIKWSRQNNYNYNDIETVSKFKHLVSSHFLSMHRVSQYAELLHISPKYLNQVVKRVMGVTAKSIITEQLILQASRDLKFSGESIKEISAKLGFGEPDHFSHFFKKETGIAPSAYRMKSF